MQAYAKLHLHDNYSNLIFRRQGRPVTPPATYSLLNHQQQLRTQDTTTRHPQIQIARLSLLQIMNPALQCH